jgi:hypothetical protein
LRVLYAVGELMHAFCRHDGEMISDTTNAVKACDRWIHSIVFAEVVGRGVERDSERQQHGKRVYRLCLP